MKTIPEPSLHHGKPGYGYDNSESLVFDLFRGDRKKVVRLYVAVACYVLDLPEDYYEDMGKPDAKTNFANLGKFIVQSLASDERCRAFIGDTLAYVRLENSSPDIDTQRKLIAEALGD